MSENISVRTEETKKNVNAEKVGLGFAMGAFSFMIFGSILNGAKIMTALIRGFEGALVFGSLAWFLGWYLLTKLTPNSEIEGESPPDP